MRDYEGIMVTLGQIRDHVGGTLHHGGDEVEITDCGLNSKTLPPGALFAGVPGTRAHGAQFAATTQCAAVLTDEAGLAYVDPQMPTLVVEDVYAVLGEVSSLVYGDPSAQLTIIGITGTSGKTTTSYMVEQCLRAAGHSVGLIGTTGTRINGQPVPTELTTPQAPDLQKLFRTMADQGVTHVVMEVSSHAIALGRITGTHFTAVGFTNLSQDHLDFHPTMQDYFETKARLFHPAAKAPDGAQLHTVICIDDDWGERLAARTPGCVTVSSTRPATLWAGPSTTSSTGLQQVAINGFDHPLELDLPMPGRFNVANALVAMGLLAAVGVAPQECLKALSTVAVPGRLERIDEGQDFLVVVDYAHKPGAIAAILGTLRQHMSGRLCIVVGAGGDRDHSKRGPMGEESARGADCVIITDDNPRSEDPASIRRSIVEGAMAVDGGAEVMECGDRRQAIARALAWARAGDTVVIAGKGHETGQLVNGVVHPFDDRAVARQLLQEMKEK